VRVEGHAVAFVVTVAPVAADQVLSVHEIPHFLRGLGGLGDEDRGRGSRGLLPHDLHLEKGNTIGMGTAEVGKGNKDRRTLTGCCRLLLPPLSASKSSS
jgi:hypothetical protein